jgi:hypothetical protein
MLRSWGGIALLSPPFGTVEQLFSILDAPRLHRVRLDAIFRYFCDNDIRSMSWGVVDKHLVQFGEKQGSLTVCLRFLRFPDPVFYPAPLRQLSHGQVVVAQLLPLCTSKSSIDLVESL